MQRCFGERQINDTYQRHAAKRGEIAIEGTIVSVDAKAKRLTLKANVITLSGKNPTNLNPPREKIVLLGSATIIDKDISQKEMLSDLKNGLHVSTIGRDLGPGKSLPARLILIKQASVEVFSGPNDDTAPMVREVPQNGAGSTVVESSYGELRLRVSEQSPDGRLVTLRGELLDGKGSMMG